MPAPGEALGPYTLVRSLGSGGMGEVWAATASDGAEVAVKVLPEGALGDATARARFAREVAAAQRVQDPRVQAVLAADAEALRPWLATELVVGPTLAQRVAADGPLPGPELHALATGLADALVAVHAAGVLHRDVSPANVVLGGDGPVLVTDAPVTVTATNLNPRVGLAFTATVATFVDDNPFGIASDFTATINWGDGQTSTGLVSDHPLGGFQVTGSHAYASSGTFTTQVTVREPVFGLSPFVFR